MDLCTPQKLPYLRARKRLFGQSESANFTKMLIFTICQRDRLTDRQMEDRLVQQDPLSRGKKGIPWAGLRTPHSNKVTVARRRRKNGYFIIFSLRTCLGCARNASCSVRLVAPGPSWAAPRAPPRGVPTVFALNGQQIPKTLFLPFGRAKWRFSQNESFFGNICDGSLHASKTVHFARGRAYVRPERVGDFRESADFLRSVSVTRTQTEDRLAQ